MVPVHKQAFYYSLRFHISQPPAIPLLNFNKRPLFVYHIVDIYLDVWSLRLSKW